MRKQRTSIWSVGKVVFDSHLKEIIDNGGEIVCMLELESHNTLAEGGHGMKITMKMVTKVLIIYTQKEGGDVQVS